MSLIPPRTLTLYSPDTKFKIQCTNEKTTLVHPICVEINELCLPDIGNVNTVIVDLVKEVNDLKAIIKLIPIEQWIKISSRLYVNDNDELVCKDYITVEPTAP